MENTGKTSIIYQEYWFSSILMIILVHNFNPVFLRILVEPVSVPESTTFPNYQMKRMNFCQDIPR